MLTKRWFYLFLVVLGAMMLPFSATFLNSTTATSIVRNDENQAVDQKKRPQIPFGPEMKPSVATPPTRAIDSNNPPSVQIKPSNAIPSNKPVDQISPAQIPSEAKVKPSTPISSPSKATDPINPSQTTPETKLKQPVPLQQNHDLVDLKTIAPHIRQDIRYATANNFMKRKLYPVSRCLLHDKVAQKLKQVQLELEKDNLGLQVFDCYRPLSIQKQMWKILPDSNFVANPAQGSRHNRASAVDLTLVDLNTGNEVEMPSGYDEFSKKAHINYASASKEAKKNRKRLRVVMEKNGFKGISTEWWHYDSSDWKKYPLIDISWN
jgi:zinc D-Ala-D-Ala dipeptidase